MATPISNHRGTVATVDGRGHNVVLSWLNDYRGGYELLLIDVETGKAEEYPLPFPPGDHPFASILSSRNKFYTHFNSRFVEFDPATRAFTFCGKTTPRMAMSMTEDDRGIIWSATYPNSGLVSFDPETREFKDHGYLYKQNWAQYPRSVAADDAGWIYLGIGSTRGQIIAFDPQSGAATPLVPEEQRVHGYSTVERDRDGKVYAVAHSRQERPLAEAAQRQGHRHRQARQAAAQTLHHAAARACFTTRSPTANASRPATWWTGGSR